MNSVTLVGRLTKAVELRTTQSGIYTASGTLAVDRTFKDKDGNKQTDFINFVIWQKSAEKLADWTDKGTRIGLTGAIQTRNYENKEGQRVYVTEVSANNFYMLDSKQEQTQQQGDPFEGSPMDISNDDLPF